MPINQYLAQGGMPRQKTLLDEYLGRAQQMREQAMAEKEQQQQMSLRNMQMQKYQQDMNIAAQEQKRAAEQRDILTMARQQFDRDVASGMDVNTARRKFANTAMGYANPTVIGQMWGQMQEPAEQTIYGVPISEATDDMIEAYSRGDKTFAGSPEDLELTLTKPTKFTVTEATNRFGSWAEDTLEKDQRGPALETLRAAVDNLLQRAYAEGEFLDPNTAQNIVEQNAADFVEDNDILYGKDVFNPAKFNARMQSIDIRPYTTKPYGRQQVTPTPVEDATNEISPQATASVPDDLVAQYKEMYPDRTEQEIRQAIAKAQKAQSAPQPTTPVAPSAPLSEDTPSTPTAKTGYTLRNELDMTDKALTELTANYAKTQSPDVMKRIQELMKQRREILSALNNMSAERLQGIY